MSMATSPPRRQMPPPPPPRRAAPAGVASVEVVAEDSPKPLSIAARIANLQLNPQPPPTHRGAGIPSTSKIGLSASVTVKAPSKIFALVLAGLDPEYLSQLLSRPPPPVPVKPYQGSIDESDYGPPPQLPPRRPPLRRPLPPQSNHDHTLDENGIPDPETHQDTHTQVREEGLYQNYDSSVDANATTQTNVVQEEPPPNGLFPEGTCIKCYDFSYVDAHAAQFLRQYVASLDELADNLTEPFAYETEKARAIFTWLHHNIQYDTQSFFAGAVKPATPESVLSSGLAVCDGYAGLFVYLAELAGLQVHKVSGHGKGFGYQELAPGEPVPSISHNHAWNCVLMDGEWRLIDATWGAGALNGSTYEQRFDPSWFSSSPVEFAKRHFPSDPTYQLLSEEEGGPVSWEEYIMRPPGPIIFSDFHRLNFLVDLLQPTSDAIGRGQTVTFTLVKRCEHMSNHDADNYVYILHFPDYNEPTPLEPNAEGGWTLTYTIPDQPTEVSLLFVVTVDGRDAKGIGIQGFNSAVDRRPMTFGGLVKWAVS